MKPIISQKNDTIIIEIKGEYFVDTIAEISKLADSKDLNQFKNIIVDCSELEYIDNCGSELNLLEHRFREVGGKNFLIVNDDENIKTVFNFLKLESENEFEFVSNIEDAIKVIEKRI